MSYPLDTFAERVWYAYQCLPRPKGKLPSKESLENYVDPKTGLQRGRDDGPSFGTFSKLFKGNKVEPRPETRAKIANVLGVDVRWLDYRDGTQPRLTGPYRRMRKDESLAEYDLGEQVKKYDAIGGVDGQSNHFRTAVLFYKSVLDLRAIEDVAKAANGRENGEEPIEWARQLRLAQIKHTGKGFDLALPEKLEPIAAPAPPQEVHTKRKRAS